MTQRPALPSPEGPVVRTATAAAATSSPSTVRDWVELTKPEITFLVAISSLAGFVLGSPGPVDWLRLAALVAGVVLSSAGGSTLNHVFERSLDGEMRRTASRPLPSGRIAPAAALRFGVVLVAAGLAVLCPLVNPLTGVLAALTVLVYVFVYTPLKRVTAWNTLVGTIPGALPALGGWTAATGGFGPTGWAVFAVLVCWQVPHFFSLAWMYRQDYARARYAMLPVIAPGGTSTVVHVLVFSVLTAVASLLPWRFGDAGPVYAAGIVPLALTWVPSLTAFARTRSNTDARRVLMATIWYIPAWVVLIVLDRLV